MKSLRILLFFLVMTRVSGFGQNQVDIAGVRFVLISPVQSSSVKKFWISETEITWRQFSLWKRMLAKNAAIKLDVPTGDEPIPALGRPSNDYRGQDDAAVAGISPCGAVQFSRIFSLHTGRFARLPTQVEWKYLMSIIPPTDDSIRIFQRPDWRSVSAQMAPLGKLGIRGVDCNVGEWVMNDDYPITTTLDRKSLISESFTACGPRFPVENVGQSRMSVKADYGESMFDFDDHLAWATLFPDRAVGFRLVVPVDPPPKEMWSRFWKVLPTDELESVWKRLNRGTVDVNSDYSGWFR